MWLLGQITYYIKVEMFKAGPERYQNKEGPLKPAIRVIKEGDKEESLSFLSKKWFYKTLKNSDEVLRSWLLYSNSHSGLYCFCSSCFNQKIIILNSFPHPLLISAI